jgi:hypothetical protein
VIYLTAYITAAQFSSITGVTWQEAGETGSSSTTIRDDAIDKAQLQFEKEISDTFEADDTDYEIAQECVAFLAAHLVATRKQSLFGSGEINYYYLNEYRRLKKLIKTTEEDKPLRIFDAKFSTVEVEERYDEEP